MQEPTANQIYWEVEPIIRSLDGISAALCLVIEAFGLDKGELAADDLFSYRTRWPLMRDVLYMTERTINQARSDFDKISPRKSLETTTTGEPSK